MLRDQLHWSPFDVEPMLKVRDKTRKCYTAPTATARTTPTFHPMPDGFSSLVTIGAGNVSIQLWERQIKPPGYDGGEMIDTATMFATLWRTKWPKSLLTHEAMTMECGYQPDAFATIITSLNRPATITVKYPDGSTEAFYGALNKFEKGELKEGEFPMATATITPMSWDYTNNVEAGPTIVAASGT